jgi:predicted alpha/beta-hydrolase family hydrolase
MNEEFVPTPVGPARITWCQPDGPARAVAMLGHGSATGIESADLQALASALPGRGVAVVLITQPYRLARNRSSRASDEGSLDIAWRGVWPYVASRGLPVIAGGRSAGSQVAVRTAKELGAVGVLALAYPLLGPGSPRELLATGLPMLIVQGGLDPYGRPAQFPPLPASARLIDVPHANHTFATPGIGGDSATPPMAIIADAVTTWAVQLLAPRANEPPALNQAMPAAANASSSVCVEDTS